MKLIDKIKTQVGVILFLQLVGLFMLFALGFNQIAIALIIILFVDTTLLIWILYTMQSEKASQDIEISKVLGKEAKGAFDFGKVGIIAYNDQYEVTWVSDFLIQREINLVGKKATAFFEEINELFNGDVDVVSGEYDGIIYEVYRKEEGHVLFVKDINRLANVTKKYEDESLVLGLVHIDNYSDIASFEDESKIASVNLNIRQPIIDWANSYGMIIRRLRSDRFLVVLDETIYRNVLNDNFSILQATRDKANEIDVSVSLSIGFARGHANLDELDDIVNDCLELAQSRGGDQVAVKKYGEDTRYFGGSSEAKAQRSRVRVRVIAQALKEIVDDSDKIFISGHKIMDFDCMGACLSMSRLVQAYGKEVYIVSESGGKESHLEQAMQADKEILNSRHHFISEEEAIRIKNNRDLLISVDYHNPNQSNAENLIVKSERLVVIDHHRRSNNFINKPLLVYIESSASSTCELISELINYQPIKVDINEVEANIMYAGILVDTNRFRSHTDFRTFEACAILKKWGVDSVKAESLLKESFDEFNLKTKIYKQGEIYHHNLIISCVNDSEIIPRSTMSMGADSMLEIAGIEASFVVARTGENEVSVSARSKGNVNVQVIMEAMNGGGHFAAAAVQVNDTNTDEVSMRLKETIDQIMKEGENDESNSN